MKLLERMQCWLGEHPNVEAFLWFVAAVACLVLSLLWLRRSSRVRVRAVLMLFRDLVFRCRSVRDKSLNLLVC